MIPEMTADSVAMLVGVVMGVGSMLYYNVYGHWIHKWECVHRNNGHMRNFPNFFECRECGKRKVTRRDGSVTDREKKWINHEWANSWEPWELGPPPPPQKKPSKPEPGTVEYAAKNLATYSRMMFTGDRWEEVEEEEVMELRGDNEVIARYVTRPGYVEGSDEDPHRHMWTRTPMDPAQANRAWEMWLASQAENRVLDVKQPEDMMIVERDNISCQSPKSVPFRIIKIDSDES